MKVSTLIHASGVPLEKIADSVGVSVGSVHNWMASRNAPRRSKFQALADVLGVTVDKVERAARNSRKKGQLLREETFAGFVTPSKGDRSQAEDIALDALALASDIIKLDAAHRETVTTLVHSLSSKPHPSRKEG